MSRLQRLIEIARHVGLHQPLSYNTDILENRIRNFLATVANKRQRVIYCICAIRDHIGHIYMRNAPSESIACNEYDMCLDNEVSIANRIVSALGYRFDTDISKEDYSQWTDEDLHRVLNFSLRLPEWRLTRLITAMVDIVPENKKQTHIVYPRAVHYLLNDNNDSNDFSEIYRNVFTTDAGMFLLRMKGWDEKSLVIVLILLGADYPINVNSLNYTKLKSNKLLTLLIKNNPISKKQLQKSIPSLKYLSMRKVSYPSYIEHIPTISLKPVDRVGSGVVSNVANDSSTSTNVALSNSSSSVDRSSRRRSPYQTRYHRRRH